MDEKRMLVLVSPEIFHELKKFQEEIKEAKHCDVSCSEIFEKTALDTYWYATTVPSPKREKSKSLRVTSKTWRMLQDAQVAFRERGVNTSVSDIANAWMMLNLSQGTFHKTLEKGLDQSRIYVITDIDDLGNGEITEYYSKLRVDSLPLGFKIKAQKLFMG